MSLGELLATLLERVGIVPSPAPSGSCRTISRWGIVSFPVTTTRRMRARMPDSTCTISAATLERFACDRPRGGERKAVRPEPSHGAVGDFPALSHRPGRPGSARPAQSGASSLGFRGKREWPRGRREGQGVDRDRRTFVDHVGDADLVGLGLVAGVVADFHSGKAGTLIVVTKANDVALHLGGVEEVLADRRHEWQGPEQFAQPDGCPVPSAATPLPQNARLSDLSPATGEIHGADLGGRFHAVERILRGKSGAAPQAPRTSAAQRLIRTAALGGGSRLQEPSRRADWRGANRAGCTPARSRAPDWSRLIAGPGCRAAAGAGGP